MKKESDIPGWKLNEKPCGECKNMKRDMHGSFCPKLLMATHESFKIMYNVSKGTCFEKKITLDPMNTEQLKTPQQHIVDLTRKSYGEDFKGMNDSDTLMQITRGNSGLFIKAMQDFASQESKRAVNEFKEKLKAEILSIRNKRRLVTANWTLQEAIDLIDKL